MSAWAHALPLFEENFDESPPYREGERLPVGFQRISYGRWGSGFVEGFPILVNGENYFSAPFSLVLENMGVEGEPERPADVWAAYGKDNLEEFATTKPTTFSCAFFMTRVDGSEDGCVSVRFATKGGNIIFSVDIGVGGEVGVTMGRDAMEIVGSIKPEQWYFLEVILPDAEESGGRPVVNLYEAKETERGERVGSAEGGVLKADLRYSAFVLSNALPHSKVFFDDFLVTTTDE